MTTPQNNIPDGTAPLVPPPAVPATPSETPRRGPGAKAIMIVTGVVGGIALFGTGASAAGNVVSDLSRSDSFQSVGVAGVTRVDMRVDASDVTLQFGDVDEAVLEVTDGRGGSWTLGRDGDELVVRSPDAVFGWWSGSWFGAGETVVLTLPERLQTAGVDADLNLTAGSLDVDGAFGDLSVDVSAGALTVAGSARSLDAQMGAGRADILLDGVDEAGLNVSAGNLMVRFTGTPPSATSVDASAGSVRLTMPDEQYLIVQDVSAGTLDATVDQSASARRVIDVTLSAGTVVIRPGG